ncbi:MAG: hypothetical protein ACKO3K_03065 [Cuspidothrix sp.]
MTFSANPIYYLNAIASPQPQTKMSDRLILINPSSFAVSNQYFRIIATLYDVLLKSQSWQT